MAAATPTAVVAAEATGRQVMEAALHQAMIQLGPKQVAVE
jgi:hypothetical protein